MTTDLQDMPATAEAQPTARPPRLRRRRMSAPPPRAAPPRLPPCRPLPLSLEALDLSPASPAQALSSLRFLVLSYLADLERRLSLFESAEWASTALDMLHAIRADVSSHLPDLPDVSFSDLHLPDVKGLVARIEFSRPLSYVPTLSARLRSLHAHLADEFPSLDSFSRPSFDFEFRRPSFDFHRPSFDFDFDFSAPPVLREMLDAFRADVDTFLAELPSLPAFREIPSAFDAFLADLPSLPASLSRANSSVSLVQDFPSQEDALAKADYGRRLISYTDLPLDWRNNQWVVTGYRFIPLSHWPRLPLSLLQLHNETLNIHTHFIPMVMWGAAFYGLDIGPLPPWLQPLSPWLEWFARPVAWVAGDWARYTPFAGPHPPLPADEVLFTVFALMCLASSTLWHTMAGCAHKGAMETCARVDYVGIGWLIATSIATVVHHGYACAEQAVDATPLGHTILHPSTLLHTGAGEKVVDMLHTGAEALMHPVDTLLSVHPVDALLNATGGHTAEVVEANGGFVGTLKDAMALLNPAPLSTFLFPFTAPIYVVARGLAGMYPLVEPLLPFLHRASETVTPLFAPLLSVLSSVLTLAAAPLSPLLSLPGFVANLASSLRTAASWPAYHPVGAACLLLCAAAGVSGNVLPFCDWFNRVENRLWRLAFFVGISFSALAPLAGIAALQGWDAMLTFVAPIGPSLLYYVVGLVIYATQVPERFVGGGGGWVGRVSDLCGGGSHAIWHVFIVLAIRAHRDGIREMRRAAAEGGCAIGVSA